MLRTLRDDSDLDAWWPISPPQPWEVEFSPGVDLVVLNGAPLELAGRVALEGRVLFDDDPPARVHWFAETRKIWLDERPRFQRAHGEFLEAAAAAVVDEGRGGWLLRAVSERTNRLRAVFEVPLDERGDLWLDGVKYPFVTAIEGCVDVAQHIVSSEELGAPDSNADAVRLNVADIDVDLAHRMALTVGFRNVLVHQYAHVDDAVVLAAVDRLGDFDDFDDFDDFVARISRWLTSAS